MDTRVNGWLAATNILAVRLDNAGDVVMLGPALRAVKENSPAARITLLATPAGTQAARLLPWVDDVLTWRPIWQDLGHLPFAPERELELVALLAARHFEAALIFSSFSQTPHVAGYVCYLAGIPLRAGESKEFGGRCLTSELRGAPDALHQVERNLRLVEQLGFVARDRRLALCVGEDAQVAAARSLEQLGIDARQGFVLLHPGASAHARRYPPERWAALARELLARGQQVLVTGSAREAELVATLLAEAPGARTLPEETSIESYAALIAAAALVICGNTLPLHLADALATPVLALYSGTDLEDQWRPRFTPSRLLRRPTPCHPCYLLRCPFELACLDFSAAQVADAAEELLEASSCPPLLHGGSGGAAPERGGGESLHGGSGAASLHCGGTR
jgi:ADP-heptose:LPS heptosyltransferase